MKIRHRDSDAGPQDNGDDYVPTDEQVITAAVAIGHQLEPLGMEPDLALHQGFVIVERFLTNGPLADERLEEFQKLYEQCYSQMFNDGFPVVPRDA
jgi:hypothetical protein